MCRRSLLEFAKNQFLDLQGRFAFALVASRAFQKGLDWGSVGKSLRQSNVEVNGGILRLAEFEVYKPGGLLNATSLSIFGV